MKKFKKLCATLSLAAAMTLGAGIAAPPAYANCLAPLTVINADGSTSSGFISCGSSAGNYIGMSDGSNYGGGGVDLICDLLAITGSC
jgi:hypothetical protein